MTVLWPFRNADSFKTIRSVFGDYLSEETLAKLEDGSALPDGFPSLEQKSVYFALIQVRDEQAEDVPPRIGRAGEFVLAHHAMLETTCSSFILATW